MRFWKYVKEELQELFSQEPESSPKIKSGQDDAKTPRDEMNMSQYTRNRQDPSSKDVPEDSADVLENVSKDIQEGETPDDLENIQGDETPKDMIPPSAGSDIKEEPQPLDASLNHDDEVKNQQTGGQPETGKEPMNIPPSGEGLENHGDGAEEEEQTQLKESSSDAQGEGQEVGENPAESQGLGEEIKKNRDQSQLGGKPSDGLPKQINEESSNPDMQGVTNEQISQQPQADLGKIGDMPTDSKVKSMPSSSIPGDNQIPPSSSNDSLNGKPDAGIDTSSMPRELNPQKNSTLPLDDHIEESKDPKLDGESQGRDEVGTDSNNDSIKPSDKSQTDLPESGTEGLEEVQKDFQSQDGKIPNPKDKVDSSIEKKSIGQDGEDNPPIVDIEEDAQEQEVGSIRKKIEALESLKDELEDQKDVTDFQMQQDVKREQILGKQSIPEDSVEKEYTLDDQTNKFLEQLGELPSFKDRERGPGYSIDTRGYTPVPDSVIRTLITKFLNQRFCKRDTDLNVRSNSLDETQGFFKWKVRDVIIHLETEQITKVLTDKFGYQYANGKNENVPLSFYFDLSGSMSSYTNMLAVIAIELLKKDVKVLVGYNERVNVQIDKINGSITVAEFAKILSTAGYASWLSGNNKGKLKRDHRVSLKFIDRNIDNYLLEKMAEKCVAFSDFDAIVELSNLSQRAQVYYFCFESDFSKADLGDFKGFVYQVENINDIERGLVKVNSKRFETLCYIGKPKSLQKKLGE